jgi:hypothetical protein
MRARTAHRAIAVALLAIAPYAGGAEPASYREIELRLAGPVERLVFADIDGDGLADLACGADRRLDVYPQDPASGFSLSRPSATLPIEGRAVGWDLERDAATGTIRVVALVDGRTVTAWRYEPGGPGFSAPVDLASGLSGFLPPGLRYLHFVRDVNGDGLPDVVVPGIGEHSVLLRGRDGRLGGALPLRLETSLESRLSPAPDLAQRIGQSVRVPFIQLRDVNGDGRNDIVSSTDDWLNLHLAGADGSFPSTPSTSLDLAAVRKRIGEFDPDKLDLSNLTGALAWTIQVELRDLDRDSVEDLILREGGKVSVFSGRGEGIDLSRPRQVLKSAGNVLAAVPYDEDGDGDPDLWIARIETVSLGDIFIWLVVSGSVDLEAFIYRNDRGTFGSRPYRKVTLTVSFPSLRSLGKIGEEIDARRKKVSEARMSAAEVRGEVAAVVLRDRIVRGWLSTPGVRRDRLDLLGLIGYRRDRDSYAIDVKELIDRLALPEEEVLASVDARPPDFEFPVDVPARGTDIAALDLNADRIDDILVLHAATGGEVRGLMLLSRGR